MSYSGASCSLTLFNLQGTRLIRQELNYTTLGNRCQELFSDFFEIFQSQIFQIALSFSRSCQTRTCLVYHRFFSLSNTFFRSFRSFFFRTLIQQRFPLGRTRLLYRTLSRLSSTFFKAAASSRPRFPVSSTRRSSARLLYQNLPHFVNTFFRFFSTIFYSCHIHPISMLYCSP